ncbi:MAG: hypothetical protein VB133_07505 [Anaeromusa sp.]|uniref:hypothetical protein n=1 Tax=Anaeromusa sp. TaxID=1872520 RepID=UPI002B1E9E11|nr:hypothetical protein [Anaeromusa sp.]MEA4834962.1 hypothetical protein [Anaeromusa sp.]
MSGGPYYVVQPSFAAGVISGDVAARVDLEKYKAAILEGLNVIPRAHGLMYKRMGTLLCGEVKDSSKKTRLMKFSSSVEDEYLLELGNLYTRVWKDGAYLSQEVATPYTEADLPGVSKTQSADVMYLCSGTYPVKTLTRYAENDWRFADYAFKLGPFRSINADTANKITPSAASGTVTLTAAKDAFEVAHVGGLIKLTQYVEAKSASLTGAGTTASIQCGDQWKIITHGTWTGAVTIEQSTDGGATWTLLRKYTGAGDYNPTESGTVDEKCLIRATCTASGCTLDLTAYPYSWDGVAKITALTDAKHVTAVTQKDFADTSATADWYFGAWSEKYGYPYCSTFYQDRLAMGGTRTDKQTVWLGRTGDYPNFGVESANGEVLADSAITLPLVSRQQQQVRYLIPLSDLIALTQTTEWRVSSGNEAISPTNAIPSAQTYRGCAGVAPLFVGNKILYVQDRGTTVRDLGYTYTDDSYTGVDLTILARHLVEDYEIVDMDYQQEPDSIVWLVRSDGKLLSLTYNKEQDVYAWSLHETDGAFESVCCVSGDSQDDVYFVVRRTINGVTKRYIERLAPRLNEPTALNYVQMDSAKRFTYETATATITGLSHLEGKEVMVLADGKEHPNVTVSGGAITLLFAAKSVTVGLPYTFRAKMPSVEMQLRDGSLQGRFKKVNDVTLRLKNSYGGSIGPSWTELDDLRFDPWTGDGALELFNGDFEVQFPGGFDLTGTVCLEHTSPYPFAVQSIVRCITLGG